MCEGRPGMSETRPIVHLFLPGREVVEVGEREILQGMEGVRDGGGGGGGGGGQWPWRPITCQQSSHLRCAVSFCPSIGFASRQSKRSALM